MCFFKNFASFGNNIKIMQYNTSVHINSKTKLVF